MIATGLSGFRRHCRLAMAAAVAACVLMAPTRALAQAATTAFEKAKSVEEQLGGSPTLDALRKAARAYEAVVLRYPNSGHCDNALWQAAELFERAFERSAEIGDRANAAKDLEWLAREYPASPMLKQAAARAAVLRAAPTVPIPPPPAPSPSPSPTPTPGGPSAPAGVATPAPPAQQTTIVRSITRTPLPKGDRVTMELTGEVAFTGERVSNPDRIFFDFPKTGTAIALVEQLKTLQSPLIKAVRVGKPSAGVTRVVIELTGAPAYSTFSLYSPFRVVVDLETAATTPSAPRPTHTPTPRPTSSPSSSPSTSPASAPPLISSPSPSPSPMTPGPAAPSPTPSSTPSPAPPPAQTPQPTTRPTPTATPVAVSSDGQPVPPSSTKRGDYSLSRQLGLRVAKIVIDPGHGGHDPGAMANGITESELVLDVALRLEKLLLQTPGVEVVLTRRTNEFVPLEERTAIANRERADLFLSIHANSHHQSAVRGIESYFLNFATTPDAEAVAARENAASVGRMGTLPAIVKAITMNDKLEESRELASLLQTGLVRGLRNQPGGSRDLGVKQAPFVVLIGAQMPSVLTEIGFLTNKSEAGLIKQPAQRQLIAQSLRDAIVRYQDSLKKVTAPAPQTRRE